MAAMTFPLDTQLAQKRVAPTTERFLDRTGARWNMSSVSTLFKTMTRQGEEPELGLEHMQLALSARDEISLEVEVGAPLSFAASPGQFDFEPSEE